MIDGNMDPRLAANVAEADDLERFKSRMEGLKKDFSDKRPDKLTRLREACQNFEAVFIGKLWDQMRQTVPKEGYLHSKQEESYMGMFNRDFSEKMAQSGGIGLADMIYDQLSRKLKEASQETLSGGVSIQAVEGGGIPLKRGQEPIALNRRQGMTLEDWGGSEVVDSRGAAQVEAVAVEREERTDPGLLSDVEVKARLEELTRRLEARRIRDGLAGTTASGARRTGYATGADDDGMVGRKLAEIG
ncbi:Flagellar protein FlgJ-like protein [Pseudodesulfovibrio mercurii]|uniref:Flagellar protein FlgJ-like protein n=1 Tax=Pseudodesulfovibrio mercurii TaxID=641491 RepID=F0JCU5_9BACT|nr:rod-binding protein [Pseudodesulfovibrio mercurii]EGB13273.1 Flagellar protein FlgJ-like protein [Pseudodesulfovibrio mercurii]